MPHAYTVTRFANDSSTLNNFELLEGRMPGECKRMSIAAPNGYTTTHSLGVAFRNIPDNKDYEKHFRHICRNGSDRSRNRPLALL